jgi:LmbE family N-acetylglucosaminyl deacetylase
MSKTVLVIAAHPDDEVLGLGGTVARHGLLGDRVIVGLIADVGKVRYEQETIDLVREYTRKSATILGIESLHFGGFPDQALELLPLIEITQWIESLIADTQPEVIYTHHKGDINNDHLLVHKATLTATRPYNAASVKRILTFETPSASEWSGPYPENLFAPNVFVDITATLERKLEAMAAYHTETRAFPHPRSLESLQARAAFWGSQIGVQAAEPFFMVREILK